MAGDEPTSAEPTNAPGENDQATETEETEAGEAEVDAASEDAEATTEEAAAEEAEPADAEAIKALKPKAIKRFNQMLSQRDEALAEARAAKAERDALQARIDQHQDGPTPVIKSGNPLASVTNEEQLAAHEATYRERLRWCRSHPTGGIPPVEWTGGVEVELEAGKVGEYLDDYETLLKEHVPARRALLAEFRETRAKVRETMPEMFRAGTPEHKQAIDYQKKLLNFDAQADQDEIIRKLLKVDRMEREEREGVRYTRVETKKTATAAVAQPGVKPAPKPAQAAARTPVVRPAGTKTGTQAAWDKLNDPRGTVDVEELMEA